MDITQLEPGVLGLQTMKTKCARCQIKENIYTVYANKRLSETLFHSVHHIMASRGQQTAFSRLMGNTHEETKKKKKTKKKAQHQMWR